MFYLASGIRAKDSKNSCFSRGRRRHHGVDQCITSLFSEVRIRHVHCINAPSRDVRVLVVAVANLSVVLSIVQLFAVDIFRYSVVYVLLDNRRHETPTVETEQKLSF
ncbi:MAG: hypothetical protein ACQETI_05840 [Halobacteriota archaeon]